MDSNKFRKPQGENDKFEGSFENYARNVYEHLLVEGPEILDYGRSLHHLVRTDIFSRLIKYYETKEEYEKCSYLLYLTKYCSEKFDLS